MGYVPQGSVLGLNDIYKRSARCHQELRLLIPVDTKLFSKVTNGEDVRSLQQDLDILQDWSADWLLNFHPDKCKLLTLCFRKTVSEYHLISKSTKYDLEYVTNIEDLGVVIDSNLNFEAHVHEKISKANQTMRIIRRWFISIDESMFVYLFKAFVRPQL